MNGEDATHAFELTRLARGKVPDVALARLLAAFGLPTDLDDPDLPTAFSRMSEGMRAAYLRALERRLDPVI